MFLNEAALVGKVSHPHIVQIYDAVVEERCSYIVMEYVEGGTLEKFCKPERLLSTRDVAEIIFKCVRALRFAHALGLTHRDIKPGNILHSEGTEIKIADFGAAINRVEDKTIIANVGSPAFMAPELIRGEVHGRPHHRHLRARHRHVLPAPRAGRPYHGRQRDERDLPDPEHGPDPVRQHREDVSPELEACVMTAIEKDPAKRFKTWEDSARRSRRSGRRSTAPRRRRASRIPSASTCARASLLRAFPENELWEVLRISKWAKFKPETVLIKEGDQGDSFYVLAGGYVKVSRGKRTLSVLSRATASARCPTSPRTARTARRRSTRPRTRS
jgi:serine/threonine protein kinase